MDSPSSVSSYSSYSLSSSFSTSPVNSDFGSPSDSEGEDKWAHGPKPDTVGQKEGSRPSPGPIRCRQRPKVSSNQHIASHLEQRALASSMSGSGVKRSRDGELETCINIQGCTTEGDLLFAQKCKELQGFIPPLTDLLKGLKMGRFERGLSTFQQSVAMDRIQRILGVLKKPQMGERYLGTLLQVEGMLKTWFPHIAAQKSSLGSSRHQLTKYFPSHHSYPAASSPAPSMEKMDQSQLGQLVLKPKQSWHLTEWPAMNLTWIHTTPICNPPLSSPVKQSLEKQKLIELNYMKEIIHELIFCLKATNVVALLKKILTMDGLIEDIKRRRYYEKPCRRRQRESYETCRRIYNMEMARKINFLMRKNRADPWQGC
ncbi:hypothetical protein JEQ12_000807 [Ovis aries]|uniref:Uncharacterized protein n=1 Tax=Ovis aries TaxID=9940 RepID=A0A836AE13_SHEEP|nr:hypothetical protein JEQ12_000807 [Ovis aries]